MACGTCTKPGAARVTLVDGKVVCTWCPDWLHECEARHILNLPTLAERRAYLYGKGEERHGRYVMVGGIEQRRGPEALKRLEDTMTALHQRRVAEAKAKVLGRNQAANDGGEHGQQQAA